MMKVFVLGIAIGASAAFVGGCHRAPVNTEPPPVAETGEGVALKPDEVEKMGIVTTQVHFIKHMPEITGFGVVLAHEGLAQAVAELATAAAAERQSRSAYARAQRLAGTPGASSADTQEAVQRQEAVDQAALELARRRLSATFGQNPRWKGQDNGAELAALASGETKLVRVTFPLGSLADTQLIDLRLTHLDGAPGGKSWPARSVWNAPADATVPGSSFFALLKGSDAREGERLLAWAPVGEAQTGVQIPMAAVVISGGKFWCYVEKKSGVFVRTEIDTSMPTVEGYFVKQGVTAGDKIVSHATGLLLARETNPSKEAE